MRRVLVHKYQRLGWCRAARSIAVLAVFGVFSSGHCFAQAAATEPGSERDRAVIHVDMGNADITRGDTRAALQNYFAAQRLFRAAAFARAPRSRTAARSFRAAGKDW